MKQHFIAIVLLSILFSCKKENHLNKNTNNETKHVIAKTNFEELKFEIKKFEKYVVNEADTTKVVIQVPMFKTKTMVTDSINKLLLKVTSSILTFHSQHQSKDYDEICTNFISSYNKSLEEEDSSSWDGHLNATISYQSQKLLNLTFNYSTYTGGAHEIWGSLSYLIDSKTGKQIKKEDLFIDIKGFTKFAEQQFRKLKKIPKNDSINETGYFFTDETFYLPDNIFLTKRGVKLVYNPYEVAAYAEGQIELEILFKDANKFLKIK